MLKFCWRIQHLYLLCENADHIIALFDIEKLHCQLFLFYLSSFHFFILTLADGVNYGCFCQFSGYNPSEHFCLILALYVKLMFKRLFARFKRASLAPIDQIRLYCQICLCWIWGIENSFLTRRFIYIYIYLYIYIYIYIYLPAARCWWLYFYHKNMISSWALVLCSRAHSPIVFPVFLTFVIGFHFEKFFCGAFKSI